MGDFPVPKQKDWTGQVSKHKIITSIETMGDIIDSIYNFIPNDLSP